MAAFLYAGRFDAYVVRELQPSVLQIAYQVGPLLQQFSTLSALYAHKNLAFIGRPGTGKTHLAQAFGRTCCEHGFKSYFIKMTELRDRMTSARRTGRESNLLAYLVRPSCLIIDKIGHYKENICLFFELIEKRPASI